MNGSNGYDIVVTSSLVYSLRTNNIDISEKSFTSVFINSNNEIADFHNKLIFLIKIRIYNVSQHFFV